MNKSGEITIFLSLMCIVLCGFIGALIRSSKISFIRTRIECTVDIAIISSFSEYNRKLFDKFHLLFVDTTYKGVVDGGSEEFRKHFEQYLEINLPNEYGLDYMSSEIANVSFASDDEYREVLNQIRKYMITKQAMDEDESNETILDAYIELCILDEETEEYFKELYYEKNPRQYIDSLSDDDDGFLDDDELTEAHSHYENTFYQNDQYESDQYRVDLDDFSYDEKFELLIKIINDEMKEEYGSYFDLDRHMCFGKLTAYVSSEGGKVYECTKEYYLSK